MENKEIATYAEFCARAEFANRQDLIKTVKYLMREKLDIEESFNIKVDELESLRFKFLKFALIYFVIILVLSLIIIFNYFTTSSL